MAEESGDNEQEVAGAAALLAFAAENGGWTNEGPASLARMVEDTD